MKTQFSPRQWLFMCLALVWAASAFWITYAQQPTTPYTFTGKSFPMESKDLRVTRRGFEAGARSDWHTHNTAQLLFAEEGGLRYQVRGQEVREVGLHGTAYLPSGVPHWHGAVPSQALTQVSVTFGPGGVKWAEKVSDAEYSARAKR